VLPEISDVHVRPPCFPLRIQPLVAMGKVGTGRCFGIPQVSVQRTDANLGHRRFCNKAGLTWGIISQNELRHLSDFCDVALCN
jgi:hypothetical protein